MGDDPLHEGDSNVLLIIQSHVVVLLLQHIFTHLTVSGHSQHKGFQGEGYLILDHCEVLHVLTNTAEEHPCHDLECALYA